ncbi:unnamed protein product [Vitrella brassicaformis CCMP3155]|uniref:RRM domain-containing protein n=2 Tax=Vitrella brassicaformis TaxID=1169539 RepID=A0A0G4EA48_VITBC|nr:unnamed protein product [Vitrella brassicaformis CCMP3155]|eukprot:CEL92822.1 unnamed protein product [Vitrella brassicaformis CCMP3155]
MSSGEQPVEGTNQPTTTAEAPEQQQEATDQPTNGMVKQDAASDEPPPQGMEEQAMTHPAPSEAPAASDAPAADAAAAQAAPSYQETGVSYQPSAYVGGEGAAAAAERHDPQYYASGAVGGRLPAALNDQERNPNKVFVGGLGTCTTSETIRAHFSKFGEIIDAAVVCEKHSGRSRGFAFVLFRDAHSVEACIREKHKIDGVACDVRHAVPREEARETPAYDTIQHPAKIFVGGLPEELDETEFRAVFERIGRVKEATLMYDKFSHKPRGFGFVIFEEHHVAERAIGMHNIKGRECEAKRAQPRDQNDPRRMGRGGYGYGGRGGGGRGYDSFGSPPYSRGGGRGFGRGYDAYVQDTPEQEEWWLDWELLLESLGLQQPDLPHTHTHGQHTSSQPSSEEQPDNTEHQQQPQHQGESSQPPAPSPLHQACTTGRGDTKTRTQPHSTDTVGTPVPQQERTAPPSRASPCPTPTTKLHTHTARQPAGRKGTLAHNTGPRHTSGGGGGTKASGAAGSRRAAAGPFVSTSTSSEEGPLCVYDGTKYEKQYPSLGDVVGAGGKKGKWGRRLAVGSDDRGADDDNEEEDGSSKTKKGNTKEDKDLAASLFRFSPVKKSTKLSAKAPPVPIATSLAQQPSSSSSHPSSFPSFPSMSPPSPAPPPLPPRPSCAPPRLCLAQIHALQPPVFAPPIYPPPSFSFWLDQEERLDLKQHPFPLELPPKLDSPTSESQPSSMPSSSPVPTAVVTADCSPSFSPVETKHHEAAAAAAEDETPKAETSEPPKRIRKGRGLFVYGNGGGGGGGGSVTSHATDEASPSARLHMDECPRRRREGVCRVQPYIPPAARKRGASRGVGL